MGCGGIAHLHAEGYKSAGGARMVGVQTRFGGKVLSVVDAMRAGGPAPIPAEVVLLSQAILDGIYRSAELGREVEIKFPPHLLDQSV